MDDMGDPKRVTTSSTIILATVPASMFAIAKASKSGVPMQRIATDILGELPGT
jgi:hypothetical protein